MIFNRMKLSNKNSYYFEWLNPVIIVKINIMSGF